MENDPNNIVTGDLIKSSARRAKEQELESEIENKSILFPTRSCPGFHAAVKKISNLKKEIVALKKSEELKVLLRIVDQGTKSGKVLVSLVKQMNKFRDREKDYMKDNTLESAESLAAKRQLKDYLSGPKQYNPTRLKYHQCYLIELCKYKVELLEMSMLQTAKQTEEARQLLHIFKTEASRKTNRQIIVAKYEAKSVVIKRKHGEMFDVELFIQLRAMAIKELNERKCKHTTNL